VRQGFLLRATGLLINEVIVSLVLERWARLKYELKYRE